MSLGLGELEYNSDLDEFMAREGYVPSMRKYHRVANCWCGSNKLELLYGSFKDYQLCKECGCLILKYVLPEDSLSELYGIRYFREHQKAIGLPPYFVRYENDVKDRIPVWVSILKRYIDKGKVLEIGCSHGRFVKELAAAGYDAVGLELDKEIAEWARNKTGQDIRSMSVDNISNESFDVIFANDVLEHLYDPIGFVDKSLHILNSSGYLMFQTVVFDDWRNCPVNMLRPLYHTILYRNSSIPNICTNVIKQVIALPSLFGCHLLVMVK